MPFIILSDLTIRNLCEFLVLYLTITYVNQYAIFNNFKEEFSPKFSVLKGYQLIQFLSIRQKNHTFRASMYNTFCLSKDNGTKQ